MPALTHGRVINGFNLFPRQTKGYYQQFPPNVNGRKRVDNFRESQCTGCDKRLCCGRPLQPFKLQLSSCGKGRCRVPTGNESRKRALTCGGVGSRNFAAKRAIGRRVEARNRRNCGPCFYNTGFEVLKSTNPGHAPFDLSMAWLAVTHPVYGQLYFPIDAGRSPQRNVTSLTEDVSLCLGQAYRGPQEHETPGLFPIGFTLSQFTQQLSGIPESVDLGGTYIGPGVVFNVDSMTGLIELTGKIDETLTLNRYRCRCCCLPTVTWSKPRNRCLGSCSRPSHPPTPPAPTPSGPEIIPTSDALQAAVNAWFSGTPGDKQAVIDKYGDISVWRFADAVTDMSDLFLFLPIGAQFNEDISAWDVSHVTNMEAMFRDSNFNGDISSWQVGNVTNMSGMFDGAIYFHQDISGWVLHDPVPSHFQMVQGAAHSHFPCSYLPASIADPSAFCTSAGIWLIPDNDALRDAVTGWFGTPSEKLDIIEQYGSIQHWQFEDAVTDMTELFRSSIVGTTTFNDNISAWNMTYVTTTAAMFMGQESFNQPIGNWERNGSTMGNVWGMEEMFHNATAFNQPIGGGGGGGVQTIWDTTAVTNMVEMFQNATAFNQDLSNWAVNPSLTTGVENMVLGAAHSHFPCVHLPPSYLTHGVDTGCTSAGATPIPGNAELIAALQGWWGSSAERDAIIDEYGTIQNWQFGPDVNDMSWIFANPGLTATWPTPRYTGPPYPPTDFNDDISAWDVSSVTDMSGMFAGQASFNRQIGNWGSNTSNVTDMSWMFMVCTVFNQDLSQWNVSNVTTMEGMFGTQGTPAGFEEGAVAFNGNISTWDVSEVIYMRLMFHSAHAFNKDISNWVTSKVTDMSNMFNDAKSFNQDISSWNMSQVTNVDSMFYKDTTMSFNQDISTWNVSTSPPPTHGDIVGSTVVVPWFPCSKLPAVLQGGSECAL